MRGRLKILISAKVSSCFLSAIIAQYSALARLGFASALRATCPCASVCALYDLRKHPTTRLRRNAEFLTADPSKNGQKLYFSQKSKNHYPPSSLKNNQKIGK